MKTTINKTGQYFEIKMNIKQINRKLQNEIDQEEQNYPDPPQELRSICEGCEGDCYSCKYFTEAKLK